MHLNIRFGNKQHFGEHQKIFYSTVTAPENQLCFLPAAAAAAKLLQSCLTLCNPIDSSPPGTSVPEILQARTLEWVAISFSNAWKWKVKVKWLSRVQPLATPRTVANQAPPPMGFSRQEHWSGVPLPSPPCLSTCPQTHWSVGVQSLSLVWLCVIL